MTPQQLHNLETYVLRIQTRRRVVKGTCKVLLIIIAAASITALVGSLTACGIYKQHIAPHSL